MVEGSGVRVCFFLVIFGFRLQLGVSGLRFWDAPMVPVRFSSLRRKPCLETLLSRSRVSGFGFRVPGFGFRVPGFGFRVSGFEFQVPGSGFRVPGSGFRVSNFGFKIFGFRVSESGVRVSG